MMLLRAALMCAAGLMCTQALAQSESSRASDAAAPAALRDALRKVWSSSPDVRAAQARLDAARARASAASRPLYNPELELAAENADVERRTLGVSLALDVSGKRRARAAQSAAEQDASEAEYEQQRIQIATRWLKAWSESALAQRQAELGRQRVQSMRAFDALAQQRLHVGDISRPERDLAALAFGEALAQSAALAGQQAAARAALRAIADIPTDALPTLPDRAPPDAARVSARAIDTLPQLRVAQAHESAAQAGIRVADAARIPDPTIALTSGNVRSGPIHDRVLGITLSVPIPLFGSGSSQAQAARADAQAALEAQLAQRLQVAATLDEARERYAALHEAQTALDATHAPALAERTAVLEKLWRAGEIGTSEYLIQLRENINAELTRLELRSSTWQSWFDYLAAAGRLGDWLDGHLQETSP